ncbi:TrbI/VirB10 family protein [Rhizobacter sp. LjRoot28]|uniref:TrbI/VirB10 family protein n=1 Tax=Rhizobacter sp. LjRoot28 TaxID=3342309 RepID=UPI003ED0B8A8
MADLLISPEGYTTPGGVPRKLLAGIFVVVTLAAMAVFMLGAADEPLMTGDQKARAELSKPESVASQQKGNAHWVDEAADRAAKDRAAAEKRRLSGSAVDANDEIESFPIPAVPRRVGDPELPQSVGAADARLPDPAVAERELAARGAASTVFDEGATSGSGSPAELVRRAAEMPAGAAADVAPIIEAIKATHGRPAPAAEPLSRAGSDRAWADQMSTPATVQPLQPQPPVTDLMLYQGTVIPSVLTRRINSDMPGVVTARVSMDVYDSRTSRRLLLPKGALLVGAYNHDVKPGQSRLQFAFTKLKMPDGSTFDLPGAGGSDAAGQAGMEGDVDRHFLRTFGSALLLGVIADRVTRIAALPSGGSQGQGGISATGQVFVDTARAELERNKSIPPTVTLEEGTRLNVEVVRDMAFPTTFPER